MQSAERTRIDLDAEPEIEQDPPIVRRLTVLIAFALLAIGIWAVTTAASVPEAIASSVGPICLVLLMLRGGLDDPLSIVLIVLLFDLEAVLYGATIRSGLAFAVLLPCIGVAAMSGLMQGRVWVALAASAWAATVIGTVLWMTVGPAAPVLQLPSPATTLAGIMGVSVLGLAFLWRSNRRQVREVQATRAAAARERELEAQLRQSAKMEAVGQLAGGVAHDFNNLLTAIRGFAELHLAEHPDGDPAREDVLEIERAAERAAQLTRGLLAFSRRADLHPTPLDLNEVASDEVALLRRLVGEQIDLRLDATTNVPCVIADRVQIGQVLLNLAANARDAMPAGGTLGIAVKPATLTSAFVRAHPGAQTGRHVLLEVSDTGIGMDDATQAHLFEPFFTTKAPGEGTGLGLASVYGIVKQARGYIDVESRPAGGSVFRIYLPALEGAEPEPRIKPGAGQAHGEGTETILIVEDEPAVRLFAVRVLQHQGYRVVAFDDPTAALESVVGDPGAFDALVTDVVMPMMSGPMLAERVTMLRPGLPVLFMSGYGAGAVPSGSPRPLAKPFSAGDLTHAVGALFGRTG